MKAGSFFLVLGFLGLQITSAKATEIDFNQAEKSALDMLT